jgi:hypothetical protein
MKGAARRRPQWSIGLNAGSIVARFANDDLGAVEREEIELHVEAFTVTV